MINLDSVEKTDLKLNFQITEIMASGPIVSWQIDRGNHGNHDRFYFLGLQNHWTVTAAMKLKDTCFLEEKL